MTERLQTEPTQDFRPLPKSESCGDLRLRTEPCEPEPKRAIGKTPKKGFGKFGTKVGSEHLLLDGKYQTPSQSVYASTGRIHKPAHNHTIYSNTPLASKQKTLLGSFVDPGQTELVRRKLFERRLKTETRVKEDEILDSMMETNNRQWERSLGKTMGKGAQKFDGTWSQFSQRQDTTYDPGNKLTDPAKWDVRKPGFLSFIRKYRKDIQKDNGLVKGLQDLKGITHFNNKFPVSQKFKVLHGKFVYNDYHLKITGPGYSRNYENNGKPFFK